MFNWPLRLWCDSCHWLWTWNSWPSVRRGLGAVNRSLQSCSLRLSRGKSIQPWSKQLEGHYIFVCVDTCMNLQNRPPRERRNYSFSTWQVNKQTNKIILQNTCRTHETNKMQYSTCNEKKTKNARLLKENVGKYYIWHMIYPLKRYCPHLEELGRKIMHPLMKLDVYSCCCSQENAALKWCRPPFHKINCHFRSTLHCFGHFAKTGVTLYSFKKILHWCTGVVHKDTTLCQEWRILWK